MSILKDQVAIITGASSGIGQGVAKALFERGMQVVLTGRSEERLNAFVETLDASRCAILVADVANPKTPDALLKLALEKFGRCDVVFNGAGIMHADYRKVWSFLPNRPLRAIATAFKKT